MTPRAADKVIWCDMGWQPVHFGLCPSEAAWKREMKRLGLPNEPYPTTDGRCVFLDNKNGKLCAIVVINHRKGRTATEVLGLIIHEATHIWQAIREDIGETAPGKEMEAYAMQAISQGLIQAYCDTVGMPKWR
ncbi:MAG: hypothetical protein WC026_16150 [Hyphomicrobium sp.]|uniref:hypothetical protein n=1 Tax=Hyphomicrobium sp. TaxID=82 RepID=UPI0035639046